MKTIQTPNKISLPKKAPIHFLFFTSHLYKILTSIFKNFIKVNILANLASITFTKFFPTHTANKATKVKNAIIPHPTPKKARVRPIAALRGPIRPTDNPTTPSAPPIARCLFGNEETSELLPSTHESEDVVQAFEQLPLADDRKAYIHSLLNNDCFNFFDDDGKILITRFIAKTKDLIKTLTSISQENLYPNISSLAFLGTAIPHTKGLLLLKTTHSLIEGTLFSSWFPFIRSTQRFLSNFAFNKISEGFIIQRKRDPTAFNGCYIKKFIEATNVTNSSDINTLLGYGRIMGTPAYNSDAIKDTITIIARNNGF